MNLVVLKQQIKKKEVDDFYVFTGTDQALIDLYINKIAESKNSLVRRVDNISNIITSTRNKSFVSQPICFVVRDDKSFMTNEKLWTTFTTFPHTCIFICSNLDKRSKFFKHYEEQIVTFESMSVEVASVFIQKETKLNSENSVQLAEMCECDYGRILLECDKLVNLSNHFNITINQAFDKAKNTNLIFSSGKEEIFALIDSVCRRKEHESFKLWNNLSQHKESPLAVISLLYTNFKSMLIVASAGNTKDICNTTGLTPFQVKLAKEKLGAYTIGELLQNVEQIQFTEKGIKTGLIEQDKAVEILLTQLLY